MKKIMSIIISAALMLSLIGCGQQSPSTDEVSEEEVVSQTQEEADSNDTSSEEETAIEEDADSDEEEAESDGIVKLSKSEIEALSEDSVPVGIYGIEIGESDYGDPCLNGYIKNNSDEICYVEMTVQLYDINNNYIGDISVRSDILESSDIEIIYESLYWYEETYSTEISSVSIQSGDDLENAIYQSELLDDISDAIDEGSYNLASALFEEFKEAYPDETATIRRIEAIIMDYTEDLEDSEEAAATEDTGEELTEETAEAEPEV